MKFQFDPVHRNVPDEDLIADIRRVAAEVDGRLTWHRYSKRGRFGRETIRRRFGSWNEAASSRGNSTGETLRAFPTNSSFDRSPKYGYVLVGNRVVLS